MKNTENTKIVENGNMTYYINKSKGTVVCKKTNCEFDIVDLMDHISRNPCIPSEMSIKEVLLRKEYVGKAKCNPEDKWNEEIGMEIARKRMLVKYYADKAVKMEVYESLYNDYLLRIQEYTNRFARKTISVENKLKEIEE